LIALASAAPALIRATASRAADKTLKIVLSSDLKGIDPVFNTATFTTYHGFLVYDQLFALDSQGKAKPQMVESYDVSRDHRSYTFRLRKGLQFHDGSPVRAQDAVASILRWKERDIVGKALFAAGAELAAKDDTTFTLTITRPFGLVPEALAKPTANALFVVPEAVAKTPATVQITSAVGSGPFIFAQDEWRPGDKAVYRRNPHYQPRDDKMDGLAGGKIAKVDRIEWLAMPDANTAVSALTAGEIDYLQQPAMDTYPVLEATKDVRLVFVDTKGYMLWIRPNHLQPPFDNPKARQALLHCVDQAADMQAIGAPTENYRPFCGAYFMCGTPQESAAGSAGFEKPDFAKAKALLKEAGYDGKPVVFMQPADLPTTNAATMVVADNMRKGGFTVRIDTMDWGTMAQRRNKKDLVDKGGWNLFITTATTFDASTPLTNVYLASPCPNDVAGFSCDAELEQLRKSWWQSDDAETRKKLVDQIQQRAYETVPYVNGGQWKQYTAIRSTLSGVEATTVPVFWNIAKGA